MPCDDRPNHPAVLRCRAKRQLCVHLSHVADFTVCGACAVDTRLQPFVANNLARISAQSPRHAIVAAWPPIPQTANGTNPAPWPGFLTRLCGACERREMEIRSERVHDYRSLPDEFKLDFGQMHYMRSPPANTCTCEVRLREQSRRNHRAMRHCLPHRTRTWTRMLARKNANDWWLRNTHLAENGVTAMASRATKAARVANGTYRACRCGANTNRIGVPLVLMCMCCKLIPTSSL